MTAYTPTILQALKPFSPPEQPTTPRCADDLVRVWLDVDFLRAAVACDFDYEPGERGSWSDGQQQEPDTDGHMSLHHVWVMGTDISAHLTNAVIEELQALALTDFETTDYDEFDIPEEEY